MPTALRKPGGPGGLRFGFLAAGMLLACLTACHDPTPIVLVDHPLMLSRQPVTLNLTPPLHAEGRRFDFSFTMMPHALCSIYDWVFYNAAGRRVGINITFVTADGHRDRFGSSYVDFAPKEVPTPCKWDLKYFDRLDGYTPGRTHGRTSTGHEPSDSLPVYTQVVLAASDSITIAHLTVKTWDPEPLFP